jgi:outer membrane protein assembly factor BamB
MIPLPMPSIPRAILASRLRSAQPGSLLATQLDGDGRLDLRQLESALTGRSPTAAERKVLDPTLTALGSRSFFEVARTTGFERFGSQCGTAVRKRRTPLLGTEQAWEAKMDPQPTGGACFAGKLIVQSDQRGTLHAFARDTGKLAWTMPLAQGLTDLHTALPCDGGERLIVASGEHSGKLFKIDPAKQEIVWSQDNGQNSKWGKPTVGPDGTLYATLRASKTLAVIDGNTGEIDRELPLPNLPFQWAAAPVLNPDGSQIYLAYSEGRGNPRLRAFDLDTGGLAWELNPRTEGAVSWVTPNPDGKALYWATKNKLSALDPHEEGKLLWEADTGLWDSRGTGKVSADGQYVAVPGGNEVKLFSTRDGSLLKEIALTGNPIDSLFTEDGHALIVVDSTGQARRLQLPDGEIEKVGPPPAQNGSAYTHLGSAIEPGGRWGYVTSYAGLTAVDLTSSNGVETEAPVRAPPMPRPSPAAPTEP